MKNYSLSFLAKQDLKEILHFIAQENKIAATKLLNAFYADMELLAENPLLGHKREDLTKKNVRFWTVKSPYMIIYTDTNPIKIVRILSGFRNLENIL